MTLISSKKTTVSSYFIHIYYIIFISCSFSIAQAQSIQQDTIPASQYYKKADSLLTQVQTDSSIVYFKKALPLFKKAKAWEKAASCLNKISSAYIADFHLFESYTYSKKALSFCDQYLSKFHIERGIAFYNIGRYYYRTSKNEEAIKNSHIALDIYSKIKPDPEKSIAEVYNTLGNIYYDLSDFTKSLEYHKKGLNLKIRSLGKNDVKTGISYNNLGNTYRELGDPYKALECYESFLDIVKQKYDNTHVYTAYCYLNIGASQFDLMQLDQALENFEKALPVFSKKNNKYGLLKTYHGIGNVFNTKGEFNNAIKFFNKSIIYATDLYGEDDPNLGYNYLNIGGAYQNLKEYDKAAIYNKKALLIFQNTYSENNRLTAMVYNQFGNLHLQKKSFSKALEYYHKSNKIMKNIYSSPHKEIANSFRKIAWYHHKTNDFDQAIKFQDKTIKELSLSFGDLHQITTEAYNKLGEYYIAYQKFETADKVLDKALMANSISKKSSLTYEHNDYRDDIQLLSTLSQKAIVNSQLYKKNKNHEFFKKSIIFSEKADQVIDKIRLGYLNYEDKLILSEKSNKMYEVAIRTLYSHAKETKDHSYDKKTYYYAEKNKANTLKELTNSANAKKVSGLPKILLEKERNLRTDRAFYQSQILSEQTNILIDASKIKKYENQLFDIDRKQDSINLLLKIKYPKYYQLKYKNTIVTLTNIQQRLTNNQTFLEFFTSDSTTYAFAITKNDLKVTELKTPKLSDKINQFQKAIVSENTAAYKKLAYPLYQEVIHPIKNQLTGDELIIVPDGPLWYLSFELLLTKENSSNNPVTLPYLLQEYAISYANSANLLFDTPATKKGLSKVLKECLAFSFTDSTNSTNGKNMRLSALRNTDTDLPGTRKEIKAIADIIDGQYYFGAEAIETNFKKNASQYNILHLALHGEVDNEHPENSKLYFTKSKDTLEDNVLYSHELFALDIPAELTVLSACNTGTGKIAKGEGIMSLGNAFQYAGTKSLLLTRWEVSDHTTPELMKLFYINLKKGMNKAKALQQAKLEFLNTSNIQRTSPFYWSGFYLVGDTVPIEFKTNFLWLKIIGLVLIVILSLYFFISYKKRKKM